jgi:hypothetical protein
LHQKLGKPIPPDILAATVAAQQQKAAQQQPPQHQQQQQQAATTISQGPFAYPQATIIQGPINLGKTPQQINSNIIKSQLTQTVVAGTNNNNPAAAAVPAPPPPPPPSMAGPQQPSEPQQQQQNTDVDMNGSNNAANVDEDGDSSNNEPIGREYIETRMEGKILAFYCKLCDCKFNDPNAKDMHTKGRRHRLAYKKKVDPNLRVELKGPLKMKANARMTRTGRDGKPMMFQQRGENDASGVAQNGDESSLGASSAGGIKPLMSAPGGAAGGGGAGSMQTLHQFMSQPIK